MRPTWSDERHGTTLPDGDRGGAVGRISDRADPLIAVIESRGG
jgi:hypothetical protein